jgi:Amt family ammonium transporter
MIFPVLTVLLIPMSVVAAPTDTGNIETIKEELQTNINIVWMCIAAFLVFFMQAGFAMVESGFTRAKNAVNILMKNLMDFSVGTIAFPDRIRPVVRQNKRTVRDYIVWS